MKILKKVKEGFILNQDFSSPVSYPLFNYTNITYNGSNASIRNGFIYMLANFYPDLVFVVDNTFIPNTGDMGGIKVTRGSDERKMYEYYNPNINSGNLPYVKVVKVGDVYEGWGSNNNLDWTSAGSIVMTGVEKIGLCAESSSDYIVNNIKAYTKNYFSIYNLAPGYRVEVNGVVNQVETSVYDFVDVYCPHFPYTATIKVYNNLGTLISDTIKTDIWGGDVYTCTVDIDLLYNDQVISMLTVFDMGEMVDRVLEKKFKIRNNSLDTLNVTIKTPPFSPFESWITYSPDNNGMAYDYSASIPIILNPLEVKEFWIKVTPMDVELDRIENDHTFYVLVE